LDFFSFGKKKRRFYLNSRSKKKERKSVAQKRKEKGIKVEKKNI
jgi:hypothetical protein